MKFTSRLIYTILPFFFVRITGRFQFTSYRAFRLLPAPYCWLLSTCFLLLTPCPSFAQSEIPIGTWRLHLSYNKINSVAIGNNKIFASSTSGVLVFNRSDNSMSAYNTLTGLSSTGISCIAYDQNNSQLLIAYDDGDLDIVKNNEVINFNRLKNTATVPGSKKINHINIKDDLAFLSSDYGIVLFDLRQLELKETWRDLGANGIALKINETTFLDDTIFAATEKGVIAGNENDNLLDFNNWKRFDTGNFSSAAVSLATFNNKVYAAIDGNGIYHYSDGNWLKESFLQNTTFNSLNGSNSYLLIAENTNLWQLNSANEIMPVVNDKITHPLVALTDGQDNVWIGDNQNGLLSNADGSFKSYIPNGPTITAASKLKFHNQKIYALPDFNYSGAPQGKQGVINIFENGSWSAQIRSVNDLTDIAFINDQMFVSSLGGGVERSDLTGNTMIFDDTNSPLQNIDPAGKAVLISALTSSPDGLWVSNYGATQPLHLLKDNSWQSFSFPVSSASFPTHVEADFEGNVWTVISPEKGGGLLVFNKDSNQSKYLTELPGNGALPGRSVRSISLDRDGNVWIGTDQGIAYFFSSTNDAIRPIFENRFLLRDEKITAIKTDGGNRKWIGTERGVYLFNPTGEELIQTFTMENSPLLSNVILDIGINDQTGEVFFSTEMGIVSYRSDATAGEENFQTLKIFPNPVTANFNGAVGINGLATDAIVKITDISGKLIWQTQANGGTAVWNVRDYNGVRASTGIYLVFAATADGRESVVGKIAVIE